MNSKNQSYIIYLLLFIAIVAMIYFNFRQQPSSQAPLTLTQLVADVNAGGKVSRIIVEDSGKVRAIYTDSTGDVERVTQKEAETTLVDQLISLGARIF